MRAEDEARAVQEVAERLVARFANLPSEIVVSAVDEIYSQFARSRIRDYIPVLVEHAAMDRLMAHSDRIQA
jgi:CRISPR/Cas system-associated exonuclease Cas4 (RecB family)